MINRAIFYVSVLLRGHSCGYGFFFCAYFCRSRQSTDTLYNGDFAKLGNREMIW